MGGAKETRPRIVAAGDSITAGWQAGGCEMAPFVDIHSRRLLPGTYPYELSLLLDPEGDGGEVLNLGRSGSTTADWLPGARWHKRGFRDFPLNGAPLDEMLCRDEPPGICLLMLGTNDVNHAVLPGWVARLDRRLSGYAAGDFLKSRENLVCTLLALKRRGFTTYLAKLPPNRFRGGISALGMDRLFFGPARARARLEAYTRILNRRIEEILARYPDLARPGPDFFTLMAAPGLWQPDGLHPNTHGYRTMAHAWADILL